MRKKLVFLALVLLALTVFGQTTEWIDDFDDSLEPGWRWVRESPTSWSLSDRNGFLRIMTEPGGLLYNSDNARNLLLRDTPLGDYMIETLVYFEPVEDFQIAGLVLYEDDGNFLMLGRAFCDACGGNKIYFDFEQRGTPVANKAIASSTKDLAYLRVTKQGPMYSGHYSSDGTTWILVAQHRSMEMRPGGVGIVTTGDATPGGIQVAADFEYFRITELPPSTETSPPPTDEGKPDRDF